MWRAFLFLLVLFPFSGFANCVSADQVTKCARLPDKLNSFYGYFSDAVELSSTSWQAIYDGRIPLSGTATGDLTDDITCAITSPFNAEIVVSFEPTFMFAESPAQICTGMVGVVGRDYVSIRRLEGDVCPDGFYTVPYDVSCGTGLVEIADIPQCNSDTSGDFCLIGGVLIAPCAAGITTIRTGTGVSIPLWAEKSTQPSLCVKYNDNICYANLEAGQATNAINVNYDGEVYHTVD